MAIVTCDLDCRHETCDRCGKPINGPWTGAGTPPDDLEYGHRWHFSDAKPNDEVTSAVMCRRCSFLWQGGGLRAFIAETGPGVSDGR